MVELLMTITLISLVAAGSIYAMLDSNRFAAVDRVRTAAKTACQERIDQAMTTPYIPPDLVPTLFSLSGTILGPNGTPDTGNVISTELGISLYTDQEQSGGQDVKVVQGTRTTRVSLSDSTLGLVRIWVRVDYKFRGKDYSYEMYAVRAPD